MSGLLVRSAKDSDAANISSLYRQVWYEYADSFPKKLLKSRTPSSEEMVEWMRDDSYFVAEHDDTIFGVVGASFRHGTCCLMHLAVLKNQRNQGIGQKLLERVIDIAKEKQASKVWLDTVPFLKEAISLYEKSGFRKCGHLKKHLWNLDLDLYELVFE